MTESPRPQVRCLVLCEDVVPDPDCPGRISLMDLVSIVRATSRPPYPALVPQLCVFAQLTECRGTAELRVEIRVEITHEVIYRTPAIRTSSANDPLTIRGVTIRMRNLIFTRPGLYAVQLWHDDELLAEVPLLLR